MSIQITDIWAEDDAGRKNNFQQTISKNFTVRCLFLLSEDIANESRAVAFDFARIFWPDNSIYHDWYFVQFKPGDNLGWWFWMQYGDLQWQQGWYKLQITVNTYGRDDIAISPETFIHVWGHPV